MDTKIKNALAVLMAIAFISWVAGGDYYYSSRRPAQCSTSKPTTNQLRSLYSHTSLPATKDSVKISLAGY